MNLTFEPATCYTRVPQPLLMMLLSGQNLLIPALRQLISRDVNLGVVQLTLLFSGACSDTH